MPFYTAEANGRPFVVFKAADEDDAVSILTNPMVVTELSTRDDTGGKLIWAEVTPLHVRPATGQEYAKWLAANQVASALVFLIDNTTMAPIKTRADSLHMMGGTLLGPDGTHSPPQPAPEEDLLNAWQRQMRKPSRLTSWI